MLKYLEVSPTMNLRSFRFEYSFMLVYVLDQPGDCRKMTSAFNLNGGLLRTNPYLSIFLYGSESKNDFLNYRLVL